MERAMSYRGRELVNLHKVGALLILVFLCACAARQPEVIQQRSGGRILFTHFQSGRSVVVDVSPPFRFSRVEDRVYKGIPVRGYLFTGPQGQVFVTRMEFDDFERITGLKLRPRKELIWKYPPRTVYSKEFCRLIRSFACSLANSIVLATFVKDLEPGDRGCNRWENLEALAKDRPELIPWIATTAKRFVFIKCR